MTDRARDARKSVVTYLPYAAPFDFTGLLASYRVCAVGELEWFDDDRMHRVFARDGRVGLVSITDDPAECRLVVEVTEVTEVTGDDPSLVTHARDRVRSMFDLDADPLVIAAVLGVDPHVGALLARNPGLRLPTGWDAFEIGIAVILGQFVGVDWARTLLADLVRLTGRASGLSRHGEPIHLFPTPFELATADLSSLRTTNARKGTVRAFARAVLDGVVSLEVGTNSDAFVKAALSIKGIGPWSARYIAMRALRDTDSFPATDLILARALVHHPIEVIDAMKPWRGYAAALLWREYAQTLRKIKRRAAAR